MCSQQRLVLRRQRTGHRHRGSNRDRGWGTGEEGALPLVVVYAFLSHASARAFNVGTRQDGWRYRLSLNSYEHLTVVSALGCSVGLMLTDTV